MKVLLVGGGAREHAMAVALKRNPETEIVSVMAKTNPGIAALASKVHNVKETDVNAVVAAIATDGVDLALIGPEAPEAAGLGDALEAAGIALASPKQAAARIEADKDFMRNLMAKYDVPGRLAHHRFDALEPALAFLEEHGPVWAIKPIGLTGGKGVQVYGDHFQDVDGAKAYARSIFESGAGGGCLQFEELAVGQEVTVMAFTDGRTVAPMIACQDHKRLEDGDRGPNTGGMGSYSCPDGLLPFLSQRDYDACALILQHLVDAMAKDGCPYVGTMYGQFMLTIDGPKVIEINARFGDPEAMNVLHLLETDYTAIAHAMATGTLEAVEIRFRPKATVVVYLVPEGYGDGTPAAGKPIQIDGEALKASGATVYFGSIVRPDPNGPFETLTSRTIGVLGEGETLQEAHAVAEAGIACIESAHLKRRTDIGTAALIQARVDHMAQLRSVA